MDLRVVRNQTLKRKKEEAKPFSRATDLFFQACKKETTKDDAK